MPPDRTLVHTARMPIRWGDMDAMGHVNNTVYFRYMEQARTEWLLKTAAQLGAPYQDQGPVIVNAACTFREALVFPGEIDVRMFMGEVGRTSVGSYYEIVKDGRVHAEGDAKIVWINLQSSRPLPLPEAIRILLKGA